MCFMEIIKRKHCSVIRSPCFCLGWSKTHQLGEEWLGNDILHFGSDSPIIIPILNFSPVCTTEKSLEALIFALDGGKKHQESGRELGIFEIV